VKHLVFRTLGQAKRLIVIVIGFTVLAAGVAMIVLPGPAVVVIPVGLAILATEFIWARKLLVTVKERIQRMRKRNGCQNNPSFSDS
jgi:tellurite resistance protein TerC